VTIELSPFDVAGDILVGMVPEDLGPVRVHARRYGIKVWFADTDAKPPREHYEAQIVSAKDVPGAATLAIEVGFHAEHAQEADNERVLAALIASENRWRRELGQEAEASVFLGRATHWRRISETWLDADLGDDDLPFEIATRLTDYITALEPVRR
jgi:hypothetical protein